MRIAVVGASGFVGGHVLRTLRRQGEDVRAVVRNPRFSPDDPDRRIADALDVYALRDALEGCDCVVHAVLGQQDVILGSLPPVYAAAQAVGVRRIVYISTGVVHGQSPAPGTDETSPIHARHEFAYNNAKVRAERKLLGLRRRGTVEVVMLRPTIVFGPRSRWVDGFAQTLQNRTAYTVDRAQGICNTIYIDNLVHAVRLALTAHGVDGEAFLVGDEETVTWRDLCRPLASAAGFDFDTLPDFNPPDPRPGLNQLYLEPIRTSELAQAVLPRVPHLVKAGIKLPYRVARRLARLSRPPSQPNVAAPRGIEVTTEMIQLHRCQWKLPHDKARRLLGYKAPVTFAEGCRRCADYIRSAEVAIA